MSGNRLICVVMGPGKKHFAEMCLESVKDADRILYWTSERDIVNFKCSVDKGIIFDKLDVFYNGWDEKDPATNGKCRNKYLEYLKKNYPNDWCIFLDEDEVLADEGIKKLKTFIKEQDGGAYNVHMRHFIGDLGHEDATKQFHVVPHRLFKISEVDKYPEHSHPVLTPKDPNKTGMCLDTTIWHLGHLPYGYMKYIVKRYKQHSNDSIIHNQDFLRQWKNAHLFGLYPSKQVNPVEIPDTICNEFEIEKDEFYFSDRGLEVKHFLMTRQWKNYFENKNVLDCGCGRGPFLCAWNIMNVEAFGFDKSKFAVMHPINSNSEMWIDDILTSEIDKQFDLVTVIDVLEHLNYEDLDKALKNIKRLSNKNVLFSIPFLNDPNLNADPTHIIKEDKDWWVSRLSEYFNIKPTPEDWLFKDQLLVGVKK